LVIAGDEGMMMLRIIRLSAAAGLCFALAVPLQAEAAGVMGVVFFTKWSALIDDPAAALVKLAAYRLARDPGAKVVVTGYADVDGSSAANVLLSELRAQMVVDALVADGVEAARITREGAGATRDVGGMIESRRVVITER
jgi:outer membrane protein OmpA-like peptidoglycan-associated protein